MTYYKLHANYAKQEKYPLLKTKFGFFNSAYVPFDRWMQHVDLLRDVHPASMRYEIGWGMGNEGTELNGNNAFPQEYDAPQIRGSTEHIKCAFDQMDRFISSLNQRRIPPFLINCYNPLILQDSNDDYTGIPKDLAAWTRINYTFAEHFKKAGHSVPFYEIWNEPDLDIFFRGSMEDYFRVYGAGAAGVKKANPDAKVGGPALSVTGSWAGPFLDYAEKNRVPLDFFSFHMFAAKDQSAWIQEYRDELSRRPKWNDCDLVLSEYNPLSSQTDGPDFNAGGRVERFDFAQEVLHQVRYFLGQPDICMINWAQFNDPSVFGISADRCGVVSIDGRKKPSYYAFQIYADMPTDRCCFFSDTPLIEGMASANAHRAAVAFWNRGEAAAQVRLTLDKIPFSVQNCRLFRIDCTHESLAEEPVVLEHSQRNQCVETIWCGNIPAYGVVYLTMDNGGACEEKVCMHGNIIQIKQYYFNRNETSYALFDPETWSAYLHTEKAESSALVGVIVDSPERKFFVQIARAQRSGEGKARGAINFRVDYLNDEGAVGSVSFQTGEEGISAAWFPWGTKNAPDKTVTISEDKFLVDLQKYAPNTWHGKRVLFSVTMQQAHAGEMAKIALFPDFVKEEVK